MQLSLTLCMVRVILELPLYSVVISDFILMAFALWGDFAIRYFSW